MNLQTASEGATEFQAIGITTRARKACAACRSRKSRCDAKLPSCSYCKRHRIQCDYNAPIIRPQPINKHSNTAAPDDRQLLHTILSRIDTLESRISETCHAQNACHFSQSRLGAACNQAKSASTAPRISCYTSWWKATLEETLEWPVLGFQGNVKRAIEATLISRDHIGPDEDSLDDMEMIPHLVELFVEEVHTKNPILELSQIQEDTFHVLTNGCGHDAETCFVLLYCALGAISCPFVSSSLHIFTGDCIGSFRYRNHHDYFSAAQDRFGFLWRQSRLKHAQALFLAGVYLMYSMKPWQALETFSSASNTCLAHMMAMRAERESKGDNAAGFECYEDEFTPSEQRIYWSCVKSEAELAHEYGLKSSPLAQLANPPPLPTPPNPVANNGILGSHQKAPLVDLQEKSWYYYLTEITLRKLEIQIHDSFGRLQDESWPQSHEVNSQKEKARLRDFLQCIVSAIFEFETQLQSCWDQLSSAMDINLEDVTVGCTDELCEYLRIKYLWIKHDLLRIALIFVVNLRICSIGSIVANEIAGLTKTLIRMANDGLTVAVSIMRVSLNTHRNHGSWFGPRIAVMSALEIIAARKADDQRLREPAGLEDASKMLIAGLKWWQPHIPDANEYLKILASLDPMFESNFDE